MPSQKIIITLSNTDAFPEDIQLNVEAEDLHPPTSEAEETLYATTADVCELLIQVLEEKGAKDIETLQEDTNTIGTA
jgi:hypothetical protein